MLEKDQMSFPDDIYASDIEKLPENLIISDLPEINGGQYIDLQEVFYELGLDYQRDILPELSEWEE